MPNYYVEDVSNNNGPGAAASFSDPNLIGVYAKGTEGLGYTDPDYHGFHDAAKVHGKPCGPYMFLHPDSDARAQARALLSWTKPIAGDLQPVVDSETASSGGMVKVAVATLAALDELRLHGFDPILYASQSWLAEMVLDQPRLKGYRVWQAEYGPVLHRIPGVRTIMWQFTDKMVVAKGRLHVDGDRLLVRSIDALRIPAHPPVHHPLPPKPAQPVAVKKPKPDPVRAKGRDIPGAGKGTGGAYVVTTTGTATATAGTGAVHFAFSGSQPPPVAATPALKKATPKPAAKKPTAKPKPKTAPAKPPIKKKPAPKKKPGGGTAKAA